RSAELALRQRFGNPLLHTKREGRFEGQERRGRLSAAGPWSQGPHMRRTTTLRLTASAAVMVAVAFGTAGVAVAQDAPQDPVVGDTVDSIIVTAQKREQSLQDVP